MIGDGGWTGGEATVHDCVMARSPSAGVPPHILAPEMPEPDAAVAPAAAPAPVDLLAELATRAAAGNRDAQGRLVAALAPRALGVAHRILGPRHPEAEDAAQESLLAVLDSLPRFRGESSVLHYATRIAARTCLAFAKRGRSRKHREETATDPDKSPEPIPSQQLIAARRRDAVRALLDRLPEEQAEALALQVMVGLPLEEIAATTGVPLNTVRSRVRLAKEAIRARIEKNPALRDLLG